MEENIQLFIKFGEKRDLEKLQEGYVKMGNRAKYSNFKNKNDGQQKNGIGNEDESTLFKLGNIKILDDESTLSKPIFCMSQLDAKQKETGKITINFTEEQLEKIPTAFGDHALVINKDKFIKNFEDNVKNNRIIMKHKIVTYNNHNFLKNIAEKILNNHILEPGKIIVENIDRNYLDYSFFGQPAKHAYQSEYRFVFINIDFEEGLIFKIDEMKNYSKLIKVKDLLELKTIESSLI